MSNVNLLVTYNEKHKCTEITENIKGSAKYVICAICSCPMFPKKILFRTLRNNGTLIFNFLGKNGHGCFIQQNGILFCKKCFESTSHDNDDHLLYDKPSLFTDDSNEDMYI
jgi:hypothetical protein